MNFGHQLIFFFSALGTFNAIILGIYFFLLAKNKYLTNYLLGGLILAYSIRTRPQAYLYSNNTFSLKNGIKLQLLAWYLGDKYYSLRHDESRSMITAGIEKSILKNALKIGLTANDIFNNTASVGDYNVGRTQIYYNRSYGNNHFKLTASYRFGGSEKTVSQKNKPVQTENSRAN